MAEADTLSATPASTAIYKLTKPAENKELKSDRIGCQRTGWRPFLK